MVQTEKTRALCTAFAGALAYLLAGRLLAAGCELLPLGAAGQAFVLHCIAAPAAEEWAFRGIIQHALQPLGSRAAVLVQAVLFAVQHGGAAGILYALGMGLIFGWAAEQTDSPVPGVVLHILNNGLVLARALAERGMG